LPTPHAWPLLLPLPPSRGSHQTWVTAFPWNKKLRRQGYRTSVLLDSGAGDASSLKGDRAATRSQSEPDQQWGRANGDHRYGDLANGFPTGGPGLSCRWKGSQWAPFWASLSFDTMGVSLTLQTLATSSRRGTATTSPCYRQSHHRTRSDRSPYPSPATGRRRRPVRCARVAGNQTRRPERAEAVRDDGKTHPAHHRPRAQLPNGVFPEYLLLPEVAHRSTSGM